MVLESGRSTVRDDELQTKEYGCLSVGRLEAQKNPYAMLEAFLRFRDTESSAQLTVVGQGTLEASLRRRVEVQPAINSVHFIGFRRDIRYLMSSSRVLLSFSHHEGLPNVVMEAVAARLPAVVSDIPEHRALLGADYPFYVGLDFTPSEAAEVIASAWANGQARIDEMYAHADAILASMTPDHIGDAFIYEFTNVIDQSAPKRPFGRFRRRLNAFTST